MSWKQLFERKSIEQLHAEMSRDQQLHRVLGPVNLTSLGVGAIIGAGIFALTGRVAAEDAGPAVILSFAIAGVACLLAALCYAEFAALVPVAGSAYTYTYATLGEVWAWIIGWDLILEYAMSCSVVAAHWTGYLNEALQALLGWSLPLAWCSDPFTPILAGGELVHAYANVPAMLVILATTAVLVIGIRESAAANTLFVVIKLAVVLFVIGLGAMYLNPVNWSQLPVDQRRATNLPDYLARHPHLQKFEQDGSIGSFTTGGDFLREHPEVQAGLANIDIKQLQSLPNEANKWGLLSVLGIKHWLDPLDDAVRSPFLPYGFSGLMIGAALVFFAFIGFDAISTHAEEAVHPQRDIPLAILASLVVCTLLYMLVAGVITGMEPYWQIDTEAALAAAFRKRADVEGNWLLQASAGAIAVGALAGMTSVILVTFLSQSRIFLAMARDGLLPPSVFAAVHAKYKTPHRSTILTGVLMAAVAGIFPIRLLEEMVSIGTLMAFALVCGSVLLMRLRHPALKRPFRCPAIWVVAPLGIMVNLTLMLFLPLDTWARLVIWLGLGMVFYLAYGMRRSTLRTLSYSPAVAPSAPTSSAAP